MQTIIAVKVKVCSNKEFGYKANGYVKIVSIPDRGETDLSNIRCR